VLLGSDGAGCWECYAAVIVVAFAGTVQKRTCLSFCVEEPCYIPLYMGGYLLLSFSNHVLLFLFWLGF
jgi:hypothetical protein